MKSVMLLLLPFTLLLGCSTGGPTPDAQTESATPVGSHDDAPVVPDSAIGLAAGTAFEQPAQEPVPFNTTDPGEGELRARPNPDFPPVIPHSIEDFATISRTENACLDCHDPAAAADLGATAIPSSHAVDLRHLPESQGNQVVGARWVCTSCHVEQTNAKPLVGNKIPS